MKFMHLVPIVTVLGLLAACTSVKVQGVDEKYKISHVCIEENPKVIVVGFLETVRDGFARHHITTDVYKGNRPKNCPYYLTYTALQSWDMVLYLSHAELYLYHENEKIGEAEFHMNGKGGFAFTKYNSVETKMKPVMDKLLSTQHPAQ